MTKGIVSHRDVKQLANFCVFLRSTYQHFRLLFEFTDDAEKQMLATVAPIFFGDLNQILLEYVILQVCKITDPAHDSRGNENHTIEFFVKYADFSGAPAKRDRLADLAGRIHAFRRKLKPARDKLISHLDRSAVLSDSNLGAVGKSEWDGFWLDLQEAVCLLHEHFLGEPMYINGVGNLTDADSLIRALKQSMYFDRLLKGDDAYISKKCVELALAETRK